MINQHRWVLLEHLGAPNDPKGRHFDLLVEDLEDCRTWQLEKFPVLNEPEQKAKELSAICKRININRI